MTEPIKPAILINGETIYPTGIEWLVAFALSECQWAKDALEDYKKNVYPKLWAGENI